jgi:hypothetical protein
MIAFDQNFEGQKSNIRFSIFFVAKRSGLAAD